MAMIALLLIAQLAFLSDPAISSGDVYAWQWRNTNGVKVVRLQVNGVDAPQYDEAAGRGGSDFADGWKLQGNARGIKAVISGGESAHTAAIRYLLTNGAPGLEVTNLAEGLPTDLTNATDAGAHLFVIPYGMNPGLASNGFRYAEGHGVLIVAAADNRYGYSYDTDVPRANDFPARWVPVFSNIVSVTGHSIGEERFGAVSTNFIHLCAPARRLPLGDGYFSSGNSYAAPLVAAGCALVWRQVLDRQSAGPLNTNPPPFGFSSLADLSAARSTELMGLVKGLVLGAVDRRTQYVGQSITGGSLNVFRALGGRVLEFEAEGTNGVSLAHSTDLRAWDAVETYQGVTNFAVWRVNCAEEGGHFYRVLAASVKDREWVSGSVGE